MAGIVDIIIAFEEQGKTFNDRSKQGIVTIILKDTKKAFYEITNENDIPKELSEKNKKYIEYAFFGYLNGKDVIKVKKVIVGTYTTDLVKEGESGTGIEKILEQLETTVFDYVCIPEATQEQNDLLVSWIKSMREDGETPKALVANVSADNEGIINFTTDVTVNGLQIPASNYVSRIAGLISSVPLTHSSTYAILSEIESVEKLDKELLNTKIENGELVLNRTAGKIRVARGVTSLTTLTDTKRKTYQKIKLVGITDLINKDIKTLYIDEFISKYPNSYDNKCLLIIGIRTYLDELAKLGLIKSDFEIDIDLEKQKKYLINEGVDVSNMTDKDIKIADTEDKGFYYMKVKLVDSMEDIYIKVIL